MSAFKIVPIAAQLAEAVRSSRRDAFGHQDLAPQRIEREGTAPCRLCLRDVSAGDEVLLFTHCPFVSSSPYRTTGPIFIHANGCPSMGMSMMDTSTIPEVLRRRVFSVRAYDEAEQMIGSDVVGGSQVKPVIEALLELPGAARVHVHYAKAGCFACFAERA